MAIREETGTGAMPPDAIDLPYARRLNGAASIWRPGLRIWVTLGGVAIVVATAVVSANLFAERLRQLAVEAALQHAEAIVRTNLDPAISASALDMNGSLTRELDEQLARLVQGGEMSRIIVWAPDGRAVYSSDPALRGRRFDIGSHLASAFANNSVAEYGTEAEDEAGEVHGAAALPVPFLELYVPIRGMVDGAPIAVFEVYQDARPIELLVVQTRGDVLVLALAAAGILFAVLWLSFAGASRLLARQNRLLRERAVRDGLTGLANHGFLLEELNRHLDHAEPQGAIALLDVDNFRLLNAGHGHRAGDEALRQTAAVLAGVAQPGQLYGRFGPDEFLLADFGDDPDRLMRTLAALTTALAAVDLRFGDSERLPLSAAAGVSRVPRDGRTALDLLAVAEAALREAKTAGGQVTKVADQSTIGSLAAQNTVFGVFEGLLVSVDTKDHYTRAHSEDVTGYALFLADELRLTDEERRLLRLAGLLHDIGKIGIPDGILRKPAPLTGEEFDIVKQHVALGDAIVGAVPQLAEVRAGVRHHHERWDGTGYLDGLRGEAIPHLARVLAVADAYSAMTTTRPYRKALAPDEALARLARAAGSQLDPELAMAFVTAMRRRLAAGWTPTPEHDALGSHLRPATDPSATLRS
ncbi:MAG TPA: diguanylate cyclase [Candidatus Limnocylindria bacterium]|nr:diguanylate cyclase [Candidatus Limnocylindria bacterium]